MTNHHPRTLARLLAAIACGDETGSDATPDRVSAVIGPEGGVLALAGDGPLAGTRLEIPPGALDAPSTVVLEATLDPTPLATKAERIGPQVRMDPEGLALAQPATLTLPLDPEVVERYEQTPADCRIWQRDGEGWKRLEQVASTDTTVTVPIDVLRTAAAGLVVVPKLTTCSLQPALCGATVNLVCASPTGFCLRRLAAAPVPAHPTIMMAAGSRLFYDTIPVANQTGIARYDLDGDTVTTFRPLPNTFTPSGQPALDASGRVWLAVPFKANVAFSSGADPVRFDTFNKERVGSVVEVDGTVHRLSRPEAASGGIRVCHLAPGSACVTIGEAASPLTLRVRARLGSAAPNRFMAFDDNGMATFAASASAATLQPVAAGGGMVDRLLNVRPSATDGSIGILARVDDPGKVAFVRRNDSSGTPCALGSITPGTPAVDAGQTVWIPSLDSPELASCSPEGGLSFLPLTTAALGTAEYDRMIPVAIVAVPSRDRLVVATRGTNGVELYELRRAQ